MTVVSVVSASDGRRRWRATVLRTWRERLRGLLGTRADAGAVLIARCRSIHTFGMRYAIDVAFVREDGAVVGVRRALPAGRLASSRRASCVLERPASDGQWPAVGERLLVVSDAGGEEAATREGRRERYGAGL